MPSSSMSALGLDRLSVAERILLVEELWDSIAATPEAVTLSNAQQQDLERRLDAYGDNPEAGSSWEDVKTRLQGGSR
jgi:putative addiction module component (TIGR02574 family)